MRNWHEKAHDTRIGHSEPEAKNLLAVIPDQIGDPVLSVGNDGRRQ